MELLCAASSKRASMKGRTMLPPGMPAPCVPACEVYDMVGHVCSRFLLHQRAFEVRHLL